MPLVIEQSLIPSCGRRWFTPHGLEFIKGLLWYLS